MPGTEPGAVAESPRHHIDGLTAGDSDAAIARAVTNLGRNLGLDMVAEGIDQREQLALLCELSCAQGQGFLFSTPLPPEQATPGCRS